MSEVEGAPASPGGRDKRAWTEEVLTEILRHLGVRARLEVKELPAAGPGTQATLSVAIFPEEEFAGLPPGRRSPLVDSMQFLANKIVNRGPDKQWIALGVGGHPEPRPPPQKGGRAGAPQQGAAPVPARAPAAAAKPDRSQTSPRAASAAERGGPAVAAPLPPADEAAAEGVEDPAVEALGRRLAEKAAANGRVFGVIAMGPEVRATFLRGARGIDGVTVRLEGEGRHRRVVFHPANPKPMPKKSAMPDYDVEDDSEE